MNKIDVEKRLEELKQKNCKSVWFILKSRPHHGAMFNEIVNDTSKESIYLKNSQIYEIIPYSDITAINYVY